MQDETCSYADEASGCLRSVVLARQSTVAMYQLLQGLYVRALGKMRGIGHSMPMSMPGIEPGSHSESGLRVAIAASPLSYGEFRVLWLSGVCASVGFVGELVVLGWLLLNLTDSAFMVGLGVAVRFLPNFIVGIPAGALADRLDRRLAISLAGVGSACTVSVLAVLAITDQIAVWQILALTFAGGSIGAIGQAARQSYAFDVVGAKQVVGGLAYLSISGRIGGIIGSLGAGLAIDKLGAGEAYLAIAACNLLSALAIRLAKTPGQSAPKSGPSVWQGVGEYVRELRVNRTLATIVALTSAVEVFGFSHLAVIANLARDLLHSGPEGLGLLSAFSSLGGLMALMLVSIKGEVRHKGVAWLVVLLSFGAALAILGNARGLVIALAAIACVGGLAALSDLFSQSLVQSAVANDLRGRAMGSWVLATGFGPIGHLQIGALTAAFGVTTALVVNGALLMTLAAGVVVFNSKIRRL